MKKSTDKKSAAPPPRLLFGKKGEIHGAAHHAKCAGGDLGVTDNGDGVFVVAGLDSSDHAVDIYNLATLSVSSPDKTVKVDTPVGMACKVEGVSAGKAGISVTVTWKNEKIKHPETVPPVIPTPDPEPLDPCTFEMPATVTGDEVAGFAVAFGQPVLCAKESAGDSKKADDAEAKTHAHGHKHTSK